MLKLERKSPVQAAPKPLVLDGPAVEALRAWRAVSPGARVTVFHHDGSCTLVLLSFGDRQARTFPTAGDAAEATRGGPVFAPVPDRVQARMRGRGWRNRPVA
ncbi:MAG: hypothetical protein ABI548_23405 [Polyangiaceae bacterium]